MLRIQQRLFANTRRRANRFAQSPGSCRVHGRLTAQAQVKLCAVSVAVPACGSASDRRPLQAIKHKVPGGCLFEGAGDGGATDDIDQRCAPAEGETGRSGGHLRAAGRLHGHQQAPVMGSGDPEVLPSGLHCRCASVDPGSMSEDEVELPAHSESAAARAVPFPCGA